MCRVRQRRGLPKTEADAAPEAASLRVFRGEAKSLLGYMYALGLGVEADLDEAAEWFYRGAKENDDPIGERQRLSLPAHSLKFLG